LTPGTSGMTFLGAVVVHSRGATLTHHFSRRVR
jgi:hypothetical protein